MRVSIVIPALDESLVIAQTVARASAGAMGGDEILVVDGGSADDTCRIAQAAGARVIESQRGRGTQMNAGAAAARGDVLVFLHADTLLPPDWRKAIGTVLSGERTRWGRFDIEFDEGGPLLRLIAWLISTRSRIFRSATGDQAIFVRRSEFEAAGGYREAGLFEDVDLARRLRARSRMGVPQGRVTTSSRRWRNRGVWATTFRMWTLKSLYLAGVPAERLASHYRDER